MPLLLVGFTVYSTFCYNNHFPSRFAYLTEQYLYVFGLCLRRVDDASHREIQDDQLSFRNLPFYRDCPDYSDSRKFWLGSVVVQHCAFIVRFRIPNNSDSYDLDSFGFRKRCSVTNHA